MEHLTRFGMDNILGITALSTQQFHIIDFVIS